MKYSIRGRLAMADETAIRGRLAMADETAIVELLNRYIMWKLVPGRKKEDEKEWFTFEVWVNSDSDKNSLFDELKPYVDEYGEVIDWHECTHDEIEPKPCHIAEEYGR